MRYRHLHEVIANRPRNMVLYLTNRLKAIDTLITRLAHAKELVHQYAPEGDSIFRYGIRYGAPEADKDLAHDINRLEYLDLAKNYELETLKQNLESYRQFLGERHVDFLKYIFGTFEYIRPVDAQTRSLLALLPYAEAGFAEYGFSEADDADPEYHAAKQMLTAYRIMAGCLPQIEALEQDIKTKLGVVQAIRGTYDVEKFRPEHNENETLYHATAYVPEILRDGFQAEPPEDRRGLGNYGRVVTISFTHDLEIARNIMRSLKEMWMIAHGELTGSAIMRWAESEGITDQLRKSWSSLSGGPIPWGRSADPKKVAALYRYWLAHSKLRSDPMMTSPEQVIEMMTNRDLTDIGVLACDVRLEPDDRYLIGEAEFRLPPDRVLSVKQVL
jgi:hypothetical protein